MRPELDTILIKVVLDAADERISYDDQRGLRVIDEDHALSHAYGVHILDLQLLLFIVVQFEEVL